MRLGALFVLGTLLATCAAREPTAERTDAVSPFVTSRTVEFDPETRTPFRATTGQQVAARLAVRGTEAVVSWNDDRQDPPYQKSIFTVRFSTDGGRLTDTVLSVPSLALTYTNELDLSMTSRDTLISFESGALAQVKEGGPLRTVSPVGTAHRLITAPDETLALFASGNRLELARVDGGARLALASWGDVDTRDFQFTGAATSSEVLVVYRALAADGGAPDLQGVLVSPLDGGVGAPFTLSPSLGDELRTPTASSDGTGFLVGWRRDGPNVDGGVQHSVHFAPVSPTGTVGALLSPALGAAVDEPRICFDGTAFRVLYRQPLTCCSARLFAATVNGGALVSTTQLVEDWVFGPQLACNSSGAAVAWSQWNYVSGGNAAVVMQWLQPDNTASGPSFPVSLVGEAQRVVSLSPSWLTFDTPRSGFLAPNEGRPDASIEVRSVTVVAGRQADEVGLLASDNPNLVFERRTSGGVVLSSANVDTPLPGYAPHALITVGTEWEAAWSWNDEVRLARVDRLGAITRETVSSGSPVGNVALAANQLGDVLVAWEDRPNQVVRWAKRGAAAQALQGVYYSQPALGGVHDRWLVTWVGNSGVGLVGTWVERDGVSDGGLLRLSSPGLEASPALACGPSQCLLTWVRGERSWDVMGRLVEGDGSLGEPFVILNGPDAELNPHPVYLAPGVWLLAYDVFEPAIGTRRARVAKLTELVDGGLAIEDGGVDGGSATDGGSVSDAGALDLDGGVISDAGAPSRRVGIVQCGCGAGGPALGWLLFAAVARKRRARSS